MGLKCFAASVGAALLLASAGATDQAAAATVQFASPNWEYNNANAGQQADWLVVVDDEPDGAFRVNISIASPTSPQGDILGFGFDTALTGLSFSDFRFVSSSTGEGISSFHTDTLSCGPGCNFNGGGRSPFDYLIRIGSPGASKGLITELEFLIMTDVILAEDMFTRVGIRAHSVGGTGSAKDINSTVDAATPVPVPAALPLFLTGLAGLGFVGWRKRRTARVAA